MKKISSNVVGVIFLAIVLLGLVSLYSYLFISLSLMGKKQEVIAVDIKDAEAILMTEGENVKKLSAYFIKEGEEAAFVSSIESYCKTISLECSTDSLNEVVDPTGKTKVLGAVVSADGTLLNMNKFLSHLESVDYPIMVERMFLSRENKEVAASSTPWKAVLEITVPVMMRK